MAPGIRNRVASLVVLPIRFEERDVSVIGLGREQASGQMRIHELNNMADRFRVATVVTNDMLFHGPPARKLTPFPEFRIEHS
jgi:hypothetical protein